MDKAYQTLNKKIAILRKDLNRYPNEEITHEIDRIESIISKKMLEMEEAIQLNSILNNLAKICIENIHFIKSLGTLNDFRMGPHFISMLLLKDCSQCIEGKLNHICMGLFRNRTNCFSCMNLRVQYAIPRCNHCEKHYRIYREKYVKKKKIL